MTDKPKRGRGRPPGDGIATTKLDMRCAPEDKAAWLSAAGDEPLSAWVVRTLNAAAHDKRS